MIEKASDKYRPDGVKKIFYLSFDSGSLSIHSYEIISNLGSLGLEVGLFVPSRILLYFALNPFCKITRIRHYGAFSYQILLVLAMAMRILRAGKPDVIYARQQALGILPVLFAQILRVPYVSEINGIRKKGKKELKLRIKDLLEFFCLQLSSHLITPSHYLALRIAERYRIALNRITVIRNGVNENVFRPGIGGTARRMAGFSEQDVVVGFVGSMGTWQGIEVLKDAILMLKETVAKFLIVGDYVVTSSLTKIYQGTGKRNLEKFINENGLTGHVVYKGFVHYEESAQYMNACDILVAPYSRAALEYAGGSPMKLYSYLGCEKAVIITDLGEFHDANAIRENKAAMLIEPDSPKALADAILLLVSDAGLRRALARNGRKWVVSNRKWSDSARETHALLQSTISMGGM